MVITTAARGKGTRDQARSYRGREKGLRAFGYTIGGVTHEKLTRLREREREVLRDRKKISTNSVKDTSFWKLHRVDSK